MTPQAKLAYDALDLLTPADRDSFILTERRTCLDNLLSKNGKIDTADLNALIGLWGANESAPPPTTSPNSINWLGKSGAPRTLAVASPVNASLLPVPPIGKGYDFTNRDDCRTISSSWLGSLPSGQDLIHCGNSGSSDRVHILGITGNGDSYGAYIGYASDWQVSNCSLVLRQGASQHGFRSACNRLLVTKVFVDTVLAAKRSLWYYGPLAAFIGNPNQFCTFRGGASWFGALDTDMGGTIINGVKVLCRYCHFDQTRLDLPEAVCIRSGVEEIVFEDCLFTPLVWALAIDSRRTGTVILRNCRIGTLTSSRLMTAADVSGHKQNLIMEN